MPTCRKGYKNSSSDLKRRCVKIINRSVCSKMNKEYSSKTRKCRIKCRYNQERITRKDKRGTRCRRRCGANQERGLRYCRHKCRADQRRKTRKDGKGSRCVNNKLKRA